MPTGGGVARPSHLVSRPGRHHLADPFVDPLVQRVALHRALEEAVRAVLDFGFEAFGFHRVFVRCAAKNGRALRLLGGLGMRIEAHFREHALYQGEWDDELHFAILEREWRRGPAVTEIERHRVA